jgi:four helix bundle protein
MADADEIKSYRDLRVWNRAMDAADMVLNMTEVGPLSRKFRLASQIEASAASVPANIAEGKELATLRQYLKHLYYARGSLAETLTYLELFRRRRYVPDDAGSRLWEIYQEVGRMLNALIASLERRLPMADFYLKSGDLADAPKPKTENPKPAATRQEAGGPEQEFEGP